MPRPTLSIITVNYNNNKGLIATLNSIKNQRFASYEHIIIDADSSDGSKETIVAYSQKTSHLSYWVSEKDNGIYDGMNKGIEHASGEYLYFLNSGDCLLEDILLQIPFDGTQYIYGNIKVIPVNEKPWVWTYPDTFDTFFLASNKGWISQQACFIHHSLFANYQYDTNYKIISDWIHAVRSILFEKCSYKHIPLTIVEYDGGGESSNYDRTWTERKRWIKENVDETFFQAFTELEAFRETGLGDLVPLLNQTHKFKKRIRKVIILLYKINSFFSFHQPKQTEK